MGKIVLIENNTKDYENLRGIIEGDENPLPCEVLPKKEESQVLNSFWKGKDYENGITQLKKYIENCYDSIDVILLDVALSDETEGNMDGLTEILPRLRALKGPEHHRGWWNQVPIVVVSRFQSKKHYQHSMLGKKTVHGYFCKTDVFKDPIPLIFTIASLSHIFEQLSQRERIVGQYKFHQRMANLSLNSESCLKQMEILGDQYKRIQEGMIGLVVTRYNRELPEIREKLIESFQEEIVKQIGEENYDRLLKGKDNDFKNQIKKALASGKFSNLFDFLADALNGTGIKSLAAGGVVLTLKAASAIIKTFEGEDNDK